MYKDSSRQKLCTSFLSISLKTWSLEHTQGFSKVWPSDLVFDPTWPNFTLVRDFMKTNILTNFHDNRTENVASRVYTRFFKIFDLVFDPKWPIFKHDQDFINKNIFTTFHDNRTENVASRAYTRFFYDLNLWPSFWPDMNHFRTHARFHQDKQSNFHHNRTKNVDSGEYISQKVSERKNFEVGLLCFYVPPCDPKGGANTEPRGIIWTNLAEVHKEMLHTKYQSSAPSSFTEKEFWSLLSLFLCSNMWPPGRGQFWPQGHHMNKLGTGPLGDATYQISKL